MLDLRTVACDLSPPLREAALRQKFSQYGQNGLSSQYARIANYVNDR
jgi:hypothetical protein